MTANQDSLHSRAVDITTAQSSRCGRTALRKKRTFTRTIASNDRKEVSPVNLSSYNSDFLSGLFADVAKANVLKEFHIDLPSSSELSSASTNSGSSSSHLITDTSSSPRPIKKSRLTLQSSSYRSRASCMNLLAHQSRSDLEIGNTRKSPLSPKGINEIASLEKSENSSAVSSSHINKQDSLAYQLDCLETQTRELTSSTGDLAVSTIASVSPSQNLRKIVKDVAVLAFPNLPSTVSNSSCESNVLAAAGLTRASALVQHGPALEITASPSCASKESFGWFVDLDEEETCSDECTPSTVAEKNATTEDLAFQASTAPKRANNHVEEMEQAYAADTIDSVLGDLF